MGVVINETTARPPPGYEGEVTFQGEVIREPTINGNPVSITEDGVATVKVELLVSKKEFGVIHPFVVKKTAYTNTNGDYSFNFYVDRLNYYKLRISKLGYNTQSKFVFVTSSTHTEDFVIDGKVALFMYANDVSIYSQWETYGTQLIEDEGFTDVKIYGSPTNWEACINTIDQIETSNSLVFILIHSHGGYNPNLDFDNEGDSVSFIYENEDWRYIIGSSEFTTKIQTDLESQNIIVLVDACEIGDFVYEYTIVGKWDRVYMMAASEAINFAPPEHPPQPGEGDYPAFRYYGPTGTFDPEDPGFDEDSAIEGAFIHFYFDYLSQGYNHLEVFNYAHIATKQYAYDNWYNEILDLHGWQYPLAYSNLLTTWFG
jgi:hypothetical protein